MDLYQNLPDDLKNDILETIKNKKSVYDLLDKNNYTTKELARIFSSVLNIDANDIDSQEKIFTHLSLIDKAGIHNIDKIIIDGWPDRYMIPNSDNGFLDNPGAMIQGTLGFIDELFLKKNTLGALVEAGIAAGKLYTKPISLPVHISTALSVASVGAKGGAVIGSLIFPGIGTAIGALIVGLGGSLSSFLVTNSLENKAWNMIKDDLKNGKGASADRDTSWDSIYY